jgi:SAM-dependent methyltransferase
MATSLLHRLYGRVPRPPSVNYSLRQFQHNPYQILPAGATVLDLGAKSIRGGYWPGADRVRLIALDLQTVPSVDVVGDAHAIPLKDGSVDAVICVGVLLHLHDPFAAVREMLRVLKPGGLLYLNVPFVFRYVPDPTDYFRYSARGLQVICKDFETIQAGFNRGPASSMADLLTCFFAILFSFNNRNAYAVLVDVFQWCFFWMKYLDRWIGKYDMAELISNGVFFFGRKPVARVPRHDMAASSQVVAASVAGA